MRWRVKKGGKLYSRGKEKEVGSDLVGSKEVEDGAMEGARVVDEGVTEGGYAVDIFWLLKDEWWSCARGRSKWEL